MSVSGCSTWFAWAGRSWRLLAVLAVLLASPHAAASAPVVDDTDAPQIRALLAQAWASEAGIGVRRNILLASALYGQAGKLGSAEGYFRAGLIQLSLGRSAVQRQFAACLFAAASRQGHLAAGTELEKLHVDSGLSGGDCGDSEDTIGLLARFDLDRYVTGLPLPRRRIVALIRHWAPKYGIDARLALAVATVESNLDPWAVSPKQAMGVMQLIPETAARFNVRHPFNAEQNIRGGLSYLRWLLAYFGGDVVRAVAAYNAGEGAVDRYGGVPPYLETEFYVARVLGFSGLLPQSPAAPGAARRGTGTAAAAGDG